MSINWTKLPSLTALRAFDAAAQEESFSAAARALNVTHAAVAQQVRILEDHLGMQLLDRSPRGVSLTPDGRELARDLAGGFAAIAEAVHAVQEKGRRRPVRVSTTAFFAEAAIFPRLSEFWRAHPEIEIAFSSSDRPVDVVAEGYDLAIRAGNGSWQGLTSRLLLESPTRAFAAPSLVDDAATDWARAPWLIPDDSVWEREALRRSGIDADSIQTVNLGDPALEIRAGEEGVGLVLEAEIDVRSRLDAGTLKIAPIAIDHVTRYFVVTPPWRPRPQALAFIDWLQTIGPSPTDHAHGRPETKAR